MKNLEQKILIVLVGVFFVLAMSRCASQQATADGTATGAPAYVLQKSGAQIWAENCIRCHNTASPATFSDTQWDVAVRHMELKAQLSKVEAQKVLEFLQSAN